MDIKIEKLYNWEIKKKYLDKIENEGTRTTIYFQLLNATNTEEQLNKDLYDMSIDEISLVMFDVSCSTLVSVSNHLFCYHSYIAWAIKEGLTNTNANFTPMEGKDFLEWGKQFVATYKTKLFTRKNVLNMTNELVNYTDKALILCLFEGIGGTGFSEILNLKAENLEKIDEKYFAHLLDLNGTKRTIEISPELYENLIRANDQTYYINWNEVGTTLKTATSPFFKSDRIFKKTLRGKQSGDNLLDRTFISRKFLLYKEVFNNKFLTARDFVKSGICQMAFDLFEERGGLKTEEFREIGDQFNTSMTRVGEEMYRNVTTLKRIVCTDQFEKTFGKKVCE